MPVNDELNELDKLIEIDKLKIAEKKKKVDDIRKAMIESFNKRMIELAGVSPPINCRCVLPICVHEITLNIKIEFGDEPKKKSLINHLRTWKPPTELKEKSLPILALNPRSVGVRYNPLIKG